MNSINRIKCVGESVGIINLAANNVVGAPPVEIYSLPELRTLSLYSNPLDNFVFKGIEEAKKLSELLLDATGISDVKGDSQQALI